MVVLHDLKLMRVYYRAHSAPQVKAQERKELIVEWRRHAHVFHSYLYVIDDRFHELVAWLGVLRWIGKGVPTRRNF